MPTKFSPIDIRHMRRALDLARRGEGFTSPNPCVGAVLVKNGNVIGEGYHHKAGGPHAEVVAIRDARHRKQVITGATLYVTLEPCCSQGRTPPCTALITSEKIKRVVVAAKDPNPAHAGRGFRILRAAGVQVITGVLAAEATDLNRDFNQWIVTGMPWVVAKIAMSRDGKIETSPHQDRWITGPEARRKAHDYRLKSDAIIIGAETARRDNPELTVRLPGTKSKVQPWRVVLTRSGRLPKTLNLFTDAHRDRTLVYRRQTLRDVLRDLGTRGVKQVLLEGGATILGQAFAEGLVNEIAFFIAPKILETTRPAVEWPMDIGNVEPLTLDQVQVEPVGADVLITGRLTGVRSK